MRRFRVVEYGDDGWEKDAPIIEEPDLQRHLTEWVAKGAPGRLTIREIKQETTES